MKPTAIFMCTAENAANAYGSETLKKMQEKLNILPTFYTAEELRNGSPHPELKDAEYAFSTWGMPKLSEEEIASMLPNLKAIFYGAGTVQYFARPYMNRGIRIFSAWGANAVPVAEVTVSEIILANKGFFQNLHRGGDSLWTEHDAGKPYPGNYDTAVGIIGAGMIGKLVIKMLKNYRLKTLVFDPFLSAEDAEKLGVEKTDTLPELFARCHVISNHLANNPQTVGMIDKECFDAMDDNGVFINTGRGQQVKEEDMIAALKEKPSRSAVLDVTWPEPPAQGSELYTLKNVFLTPHTAGSLGNEVQRMGEFMFDEFEAVTDGRQPKYEVSKKMLETMA